LGCGGRPIPPIFELKLGLFLAGAAGLVAVTFLVAFDFVVAVFLSVSVGLSAGFFKGLPVLLSSGGLASFFCNEGLVGFF